MQSQLWTNNDNGTSRVVDSLTKQVLSKAALFTLEHVRKRLQRSPVSASYNLAAPAVVKQGIHSLLKHPLFVANDNLRGIQLHQLFKPVVPVDNPSIKVVQVAGGESTTLKRNQWTQIWWQHRQIL